MSDEDDVWALGRLMHDPDLQDCAAARVTIDRITHRAVNEDSTGWRTLCGSHKLCIRDGAFVLLKSPNAPFGFSVADVDCLCCIPAGG